MKTVEEIKNFLVDATGIPLQELQILLDAGEKKEIKKKELLAEPGRPIKTSYFLAKGIVRHYVVDENENEFTKNFMASPNFLVSSIPDFFLQTKASIHCEALSDLLVVEWSYKDLINFAEGHPKFFHFLLKCVVIAYKQKETKEVSMLQLDAKHRYDQFVESFPKIAFDVPLRYIASYLNIRPETLSRIRGQKYSN